MAASADAQPLCFLHVPKTAGSSVHAALAAALPGGAIASQRYDDAVFCDFDAFERLPPATRALIVLDDAELERLRAHRIVFGHFALRTLRRLAPPERIATALREPRARLLSHYAYWRVYDFGNWLPYRGHEYARLPLERFLAEPLAAPTVDNHLCRLVLREDPRVPRRGFIAERDVEPLAELVLERLDALGFVGLHERPEELWAGLSAFFEVALEPQRINVTEAADETALPAAALPLVTECALELLERRTAVDALVYRRVASERLGAQTTERLVQAAFVEQVARLADVAGAAAHRAGRRAAELAQVREELEASRAETARAVAEARALRATRRYRLGSALARPLDRARDRTRRR